jgi:spermidine/putrescine transport system ATP-binding protein/putrescine transport system ATP-binding protein
MSQFLKISNVSKRFDQIQALDNVSLDIKENEFFALLGPSGCGKSTLLRLLAGFEACDSGEILLANNDLLSVPANKRPVNLMFQSYALFPHLSVYENVAYGLRREKLPKDEIDSRTIEVLTTVNLLEFKDRRPNLLSGGQKQRVALARSIVKRPKILLLDEPLSALDKKVRGEMQLELKRLQNEAGITFIIVTHDQEEAMSIADRIALMDQGQVIQVDTPVNLYRRPKNRFVADFIGTSNIFAGRFNQQALKIHLPESKINLPTPATSLPDNSSVLLVVRPESIQLSSSDSKQSDASTFLSGKVVGSNFYGDSCLYFIDCGLSQLVKVSGKQDESLAVGTNCVLSWLPAETLLLTDR